MIGSQNSNQRALNLNNVVQVKGRKRVLDHLSIAFHSGEVIALLGPNGAGKSSLLELSAGLCSPYEGEIRLGEQSILQISPIQRAQWIGFLSQHTDIAWPLTVETFIGLGRLPHQGRFRLEHTAIDLKAIEQALLATEVENLRGRLVTTLSGGELSRVLLARVLAGQPEWLLLDEPMTGLDPAHQFSLCQLLRKLASEGIGIIVTLHDLSLAAQVADRVILLNHGQLIADGTPQHVLTASRINEVYGVACHIHETEWGLAVSLCPKEKKTITS